MKKALITAFILPAVLLGGCSLVLQDEGDCPTPPAYNLVLEFSNTDNDGNEIFPQTIDKVGIYLFKEDGCLCYNFEADPMELAATQSASLSVRPGTYRVVCWGNAKTNTVVAMPMGGLFDNGYVYKHTPAGEDITDGNRLYYAPYDRLSAQTFTVVKNESQRVPVRFRAAHIKLIVTVKGYSYAMRETDNPYVEVANLYPKYDFCMNYLPTPALCYVKQTADVMPAAFAPDAAPRRGAAARANAADESYTSFNTPRFENDNPVVVNLRKTPSSPVIASINVMDALIEKGIDVTAYVELTIPFEFLLTRNGEDIDIKASIVGWQGQGIDPVVP